MSDEKLHDLTDKASNMNISSAPPVVFGEKSFSSGYASKLFNKPHIPYVEPFPLGSGILSLDQQIANLYSNPNIPMWKKDMYAREGSLIDGRLGIRIANVNVHFYCWPLHCYADELEEYDLSENGDGPGRTGRVLTHHKSFDPDFYDVIMLNRADQSVIVHIDLRMWEEKWKPITKIGKFIFFRGVLYTRCYLSNGSDRNVYADPRMYTPVVVDSFDG